MIFKEFLNKAKDVVISIKEKNIIEEIKNKLNILIQEKKEEIKILLENKTHETSEKYKDLVVDFIMSHVKIGFPMNLFKNKIRKTIEKNYNNIEEFIISKIQQI